MAAALTEAAQAASLEPSQLRGVGVGSPGTIDAAAGTVSHADNLPGWYRELPARRRRCSPRSARRSRSATTSASRPTAEFELGAGKPYGSLLGVFWGTGVGGGLILDGKPWHGRGGAGEIGHTVIGEGGRRCPCGRRGCLEAYAGRAAMEARARRLHGPGRRPRPSSSSPASTIATASRAASGSARSSTTTSSRRS